MPFQKYHKINIGRKYSKERNLKISKARNRQVALICRVCTKSFKVTPVRKQTALYCSRQCHYSSTGGRINKICQYCQKKYNVTQKRKDSKFCSRKCHAASLKGKINLALYEARKKIKGKKHPFYGKHLSEEHREKISANHADMSGSNSPSWRGGINPINDKIRKSKEYILWRTAVFMRDDYTCQICGEKGVKLNADHIKPFALFPELRFAIDNGRTLCIPCHRIKTSKDMIIIRKQKIW